jgi:small conductance mechanosensitive channel
VPTDLLPEQFVAQVALYGPSVAIAAVILVAGWIAARLISGAFARMLAKSPAFDATIIPVFTQTIRYAIMVVTIIAALQQVGVETTSILAVLAAAGLAIALALQGTLSNIAAGVMLLWLRPFSVGEYIETDQVGGTVIKLGLFATRFRQPDGLFVFVPNSGLWNARITNFATEKTRRIALAIGISYDADYAKAKSILLGLAAADKRILEDPEPVVYLREFGDSSVNIELRAWAKTGDYWAAFMQLNEDTKTQFDAKGIDIPYPHIRLVAPELARGRSEP